MKLVLLLLLLCSCSSSILLKNPEVTATQQLIISSAEKKAISSFTFNLPRQLSYVDSTNYTGSKYELELFKSELVRNSIPITNDRSKSIITIEVFSSVDSYNVKNMLIGIPSLPVNAFVSTPEVGFYSKNSDVAIAQINYFAFNTCTGQPIAVEYSKYGVQSYSNTKFPIIGVIESPKLKDIIK